MTAYAPASERCHAEQPSQTLVSSRAVGWRSLLVDYRRDGRSQHAFDTGPTPDQAVVVMAQGTQEVSCLSSGVWRRSTYRAGTIGLTPPGQVDRLRLRATATGGEVRKVMIYVPQRLMAETAEHYRQPGQPARSPRLDVLAYDDAVLAQMAVGLVRAVRAGAPEIYAQSAAQWLAVHLLAHHSPWRALQQDGRRPGVIAPARLADVVEHMSAHLDQQLTLQELAAVAGVSKFHFARLFKAHTGVAPHAYLVRLRLEAARRMLAGGDAQVAEVARRCGFASPSHFGARFSREYGLTPTAFRRGG